MNQELSCYEYEILEKHGIGRLGEQIFLGFDPNLNQQVMIRMLPADMISENDTFHRFMQGAKLTAALHHPNILTAYKAGEAEDGNIFLVTRFEEGLFLDKHLKVHGKFNEDEASDMIASLADALHYAWETKMIIHRNVCPETILISKDKRPMLTDFGIAKSRSLNLTDTLKGVILGNPQYMSPEQVRGEKELDFHSDMYCLGLVFYEILAGFPAFHNKSPETLMSMQENRQPVSLKFRNPDLSERCVKTINRMLEKNKSRRYPSWNELKEDLEKLSGRMEATSEHNLPDEAGKYKISSAAGRIRSLATMMLTKLGRR
ncbi:MAG TPA: hypothetical protein DET40_03665 [Lentisphaeria bacterium]|nr:MAG: hypothetical protein A2X45_23505 [Lentisphaerae bacterium GWF2_50_93]HCE42627.1 hypothetical protein [Lentisphaeria bacterium]